MNEAIYSGMEIENVSNVHIDHGDIPDGPRTFTWLALSSNDYEGEFGIFQFYRGAQTKWAGH